MDENTDIQEGQFFYVHGQGIVMAHYPGRSKGKSRHLTAFDNVNSLLQSKPEITKDTLFFLSLSPRLKTLSLKPEEFSGLMPVPDKEELEHALVEMNKLESNTKRTPALINRLGHSNQFLDNARLMRLVRSSYKSDEQSKNIGDRAFEAIATTQFYHDKISNPAKLRRWLTEKSTAGVFQKQFLESVKRLDVRSQAIGQKLKASDDLEADVDLQTDLSREGYLQSYFTIIAGKLKEQGNDKALNQLFYLEAVLDSLRADGLDFHDELIVLAETFGREIDPGLSWSNVVELWKGMDARRENDIGVLKPPQDAEVYSSVGYDALHQVFEAVGDVFEQNRVVSLRDDAVFKNKPDYELKAAVKIYDTARMDEVYSRLETALGHLSR